MERKGIYMIKKIRIISIFISASTLILLGWLLMEKETVSHGLSVEKKITYPNDSPTRTSLRDEKTAPYSSPDKDTSKEPDIPIPAFVFMATSTNDQKVTKALIAVNKASLRWFYIGDTVIGNYTVHDIDASCVTIFDGKGAYYEISLDEP